MRFVQRVLQAARRTLPIVGLLALGVGATARAGGPAEQPVRNAQALSAPNDRFIIRLRDPAADLAARLPAIAGRSGSAFTYLRPMSGGAHVVRMTQAARTAAAAGSGAETNRLVARQLMLDPEIAYAEPDRRLYPMLVPNDPQYQQQWNYYEAAGGINLPAAWDITTGSTSIVVAVIDTGILPHADLAGRTVPGYDFIVDPTVSVDGDGRDADPSDPGDGGCGTSSSWHGTHVSGTLGAASNNGLGVTGVNWVSKILPARALGKCGGYTSDIVDAMRWSAGIAVPNVPANANPARVENLSIGSTDPCSNAFQSAINDVVARGTVVVVAAGNENADVATSEPANCTGVIAVGATLRNGGRASFSNFGSGVTISAPGSGILSTLNTGSQTPVADSYQFYSGTSMSTPHVAGVVSLMLSQNPALTPAQVKNALRATARAFPTGTGSDCSTATCGAGIVDAAAAVRSVATVTARRNVLSQANGGVASASSTLDSRFPASGVNDGEHRGSNWEVGGGWHDSTPFAYPDWVRIDLPQATTMSEIDVYTIQDDYKNPVEPTESTTFTQYGITAFDVQYWNGATWVTVPNGSISGNNRVLRKFVFSPVTTTSVRILVNNSATNYSRIIEVEGYNDAPTLNVASSANGSTASATSTLGPAFPASGVIDGEHRGLNWEAGGGWHDNTPYAYPDVLQINFASVQNINEIDVYTLQDNYHAPLEPTTTMTFSQYGITDYDVQYWNGTTWVNVPGGTVNGNNLVWRQFSFAQLSTNSIRINVRGSATNYSRIVEVEAYLRP